MKTLLIHPEDTPLQGPWANQRWDLIVDLGKSSAFTTDRWSVQCGCPVLRLDHFRKEISDVQLIKRLFSGGCGFLVDRYGLDWWYLTSINIALEAETILALSRLCSELNSAGELWTTRPGWPGTALGALIGRPISHYAASRFDRFSARVAHYSILARRFSPAQLREIAFDKYDADYRLRSRMVHRPAPLRSSVVLLPSAYVNVSRMAADYARLLPQQKFLLVATRRSATLFEPPPNVEVRHLSSYATAAIPAETGSILQSWRKLQASLLDSPEFRALHDSGMLDGFPHWLKTGLSVRDAWMRVLEAEPVCSVLCGDDSNSYTRLPMLLAARRRLPTLDFHHGAFDGRYLMKNLDCDLYLAKSEMEHDYLTRVCGLPRERLVLAAPGRSLAVKQTDRKGADLIVLFSEPYENAGARGREVYAELLPRLAALARQRGCGVIVKLHPFENFEDRSSILRSVVPTEDQSLFSITDGPLTASLLARAWFGVTVESTTAIDCVLNHVPCFLCEWLANSSYGYLQQYARFGLGYILKSADEIENIPSLLALVEAQPAQQSFWSPSDPEQLAAWLTASRPVSDSTVNSLGFQGPCEGG